MEVFALIFSTLILVIEANTISTLKPTSATSVKAVALSAVVNVKPSQCNTPNPSSAEPDKCCSFPELFPKALIDQCDKDFSLNETVPNNEWISDSCVIECAFNRSGLNNKSKLVREDAVKFFMNRTKDDQVWNPLITKAVDTCFTELSPEVVDEFMQTMSQDLTSFKKLPLNKLCHPISGFALDCIYMELFKVCPQSKFNQSMISCSVLKSYAVECDDW